MRKTEVVDTPAEESPPAATTLVPKTALAVRSRASGSVNVCAEWRMTSGGGFGGPGLGAGIGSVSGGGGEDPPAAAGRPAAKIAAGGRLALLSRQPANV